MNTREELAAYGFPEKSVDLMLASQEQHIGEMHGCNRITDVNYIGDGNRDVELTCTLCGAVYHKTFRHGANRWSELRRTCSCQSPVKDVNSKPCVARNDDKSYMGAVYGDFKVIGFCKHPHKHTSGSTIMWDCECIYCGKIVEERQPSVIKRGRRCACQIEAEYRQKTMRHIGERYGRLVVADITYKKTGGKNKAYAICNCDCGSTLTTQISNLINGTKSCGCLQREIIDKQRGERAECRSRSPLYGTWSGMWSRCSSPRNGTYKDYGGRGITVCDEWKGPEGFDRFEKWSYENGYVPEAGLSLDRIDVNGNYEPSNCRYTTVYVQAVNQRPTKRRAVETYEIDGQEKTFNQWCKEYNISTVAVSYRMKTLGWDFVTAIKTPKTRKGNIFAGEQAKQRTSKQNASLNKCRSYIEANLYLASIRNMSGYSLVPGHPIGKYLADFWVEGTDIVIECDGIGHHKTKEQMENDYNRERFFMKNGYFVVRFLGSEINNNPDGCCQEILEIIEAHHEHGQANYG